MNSTTLYSATEFYRPFPEPSSVFAEEIEKHSQFFLPAGELSLETIFPAVTGTIPFVLPVEPIGGYGLLAEHSTPFHSYYCRPDWFAFHVKKNGVIFAGDFRYFHREYYLENASVRSHHQHEADQLESHYAKIHQRFHACKDHFLRHGWLHPNPDRWNASETPSDLVQTALVSELGGKSFESNWSNREGIPVSIYPDIYEDNVDRFPCNRVVPQTVDERDFLFVGQLEMWNYIGDTNGQTFVFFDPETQVILNVIDW